MGRSIIKIFEKDVFKIKIGQTVVFSLPESGSKQFQGSIHLIGKSIGSDRTVTVHAHIDEPHEEGFIPGMFVQASILTNESSEMGILNKAVIEKNGLTYVMLVKSEENDKEAVLLLPMLESYWVESSLNPESL